LILFVERLIPGLAIAQSETPIALVPEHFSWRCLPDNPALESAWVLGDGKESRPYILRVKLAAGGRISPHTHPDERNSTVLQGVLYVGFGRTFDESKVIAIPAGAVCVIPCRTTSGPGTGKSSIRKQAWASPEPSSSIKQAARARACQIIACGREFENIAPATRSLWLISDFAVVETRREKCRAFDYGRSILGLFSCRGLTSSLPRRRDSLLPCRGTTHCL
jgi:hypothetical protein